MKSRCVYLGLMLISVAACQSIPAKPAPGSSTAPASAVSPELRDILAGMARSHEQKTLLAFYEAIPLAKTSGSTHAFFSNMGKVHGDALKDLQAWAEERHVSLTYHAGTDLAGKAQKTVEARQEKEVRGSNNTDFARVALIQMYEDYEWQISLIQAVKPEAHDPQLLAYLEKSEKLHEAGNAEILGLLKKYKFAP